MVKTNGFLYIFPSTNLQIFIDILHSSKRFIDILRKILHTNLLMFTNSTGFLPPAPANEVADRMKSIRAPPKGGYPAAPKVGKELEKCGTVCTEIDRWIDR